MKEENIILTVKLYLDLKKSKVDIDLCSQILNSGTSIGANIEAAVSAAPRKDFINKLQVVYKESRETRYWLMLFKDGKLSEKKLAESLIRDCEENKNINNYFEFFKESEQFLIINF